MGMCATACVASGAWLVWVVSFYGSPQVTSELMSWQVIDEHEVSVQFDVDLEPGVVATCRVQTYAADHVAVGDLVVEIPTDVGRPDGGLIDVRVRTIREATAVDLAGCTTEEKNRPR